MGIFSRNKKKEEVIMVTEEKVQIEHLPDVDQMVLDYVKAPEKDYCNEDELIKKLGDDPDEYLTYKEKLIRFTFKMSANIEKVLSRKKHSVETS